jgi:hypothetical protein
MATHFTKAGLTQLNTDMVNYQIIINQCSVHNLALCLWLGAKFDSLLMLQIIAAQKHSPTDDNQ